MEETSLLLLLLLLLPQHQPPKPSLNDPQYQQEKKALEQKVLGAIGALTDGDLQEYASLAGRPAGLVTKEGLKDELEENFLELIPVDFLQVAILGNRLLYKKAQSEGLKAYLEHWLELAKRVQKQRQGQ